MEQSIKSKLFIIFLATLGSVLVLYGLKLKDPLYPPLTPSPQIIVQPPESTGSAIQGIDGERAFVTKVVDGDTIEVNINGKIFKVRYIGIDTPETKDPRRPVECFGKEASNENKKLVEGKEVILQKDVSNTDKYNRLLRYVYLLLENGSLLFVNDYLIREGFATALTYPPDVKFTEQFLQAQQEAKMNKKGLWARC